LNTFLKTRLQQDCALLAPGVYDALSALLAEQAGFEAAYISGASIAYTQLGRPDIGLVSFDHVVDCVCRIRERVQLPLIVDADTGFGNALNVQRTVKGLERGGASAIQLEDQSFPKRCGHLAGKSLIGSKQMAGKVRAAVDARVNENTLIIARTDAIAVEGFEAALERGQIYLEAGADVLFIEAPRSEEELAAVVATFGRRVPLLANMVEGGRTPIHSCDKLSELGYRLVISPGALVRAFVHMAEGFFRGLKEDGSTRGWAQNMLDFDTLNQRLGLPELRDLGERYDPTQRIEVN
jgi:2-methylisocitrate lyase-like PEP mutase family enzyme